MPQNPKTGNIRENWRTNSSYLLNELMNFNAIFRKNVTYDDIKNRNKLELQALSIIFLLEKPLVGPTSTKAFLDLTFLI